MTPDQTKAQIMMDELQRRGWKESKPVSSVYSESHWASPDGISTVVVTMSAYGTLMPPKVGWLGYRRMQGCTGYDVSSMKEWIEKYE